LGASLSALSAKTGIGVEKLSALEFAAAQSGVSTEELAHGLAHMQKTIAEAGAGSKEAQQHLAQVGLTVADLAALSPDEQFLKLSDALAKTADPAMRTAQAMGVMGKGGAVLLPMLVKGAAAIRAMMDEAARLGIVMSAEDAKAALEFQKATNALLFSLKMTAVQIGAGVAPVLMELIGWIGPVVKNIMDFVGENKALFAAALLVGGALMGIGVTLLILGPAFKVMALGITLVTGTFWALGFTLGVVKGLFLLMWAAATSPIFLFIAGLAALGAALVATSESGKKALGSMGQTFRGFFQGLKTDVLMAWGGVAAAMESGNLGAAAGIAWAFLKLEWAKGVNWLRADAAICGFV